MNATGTLKSVDLSGGTITFKINEKIPAEFSNWKDKLLLISAEPYRNRRGRDANACLWWCLTQIANVVNADKWDVYIQMLRRYGVAGEVVTMKADGVSKFKSVWRECEEVGSRIINGTTYICLLPYYGSSTYNVDEFKRLLDGVIEEMKQLELTPPLPSEVRQALEKWGNNEEHNTK